MNEDLKAVIAIVKEEQQRRISELYKQDKKTCDEYVVLDCGSAACRSPERVQRGGMNTNDACECEAEDLARAHERVAARLRASPQAAREQRRHLMSARDE